LSSHGDPDAEALHGRLPVTDEDIVATPSVLANAAHVITRIRLPGGRAAVGYISRTADGSVVYLEQQVVRSRRRLVTRAIRKYPASTTPESILSGLDTAVPRAPGDTLVLVEIAPTSSGPRPDPPSTDAIPSTDSSLADKQAPAAVQVPDGYAGPADTSEIPKASFGFATSHDYRETFLAAHPELRGKVVVHHAVEQRALKLYPSQVTAAEMHSLENLRGIPINANAKLHLSTIRKEWNAFYLVHPNATKEQLLQKATENDRKYGSEFDPPIENDS
jgi:hypothetical protein